MSKRSSMSFFLLTCSLVITGCSIKDDDTTSERFLKHTANSPLYVVMGAGFIASEGSKAALTAISIPPYMIYKYLTKDTNASDNNVTDTNLTKSAVVGE